MCVRAPMQSRCKGHATAPPAGAAALPAISMKRPRPLDDVALHEVDAETARRLERRLILDLLGDDAKVERMREPDRRGDHLAIHVVLREIAPINAVDLAAVDRQPLQSRERAAAATEGVGRGAAADDVQPAGATARG